MSQQLASDNFQRADENPLSDGGNWSVTGDSLYHSCQVVSDLCEATATICANRFTGITWPDDQYAEVTIATLDADNSSAGVALRCDNSSGSFYYATILRPSSGNVLFTLGRSTGGSVASAFKSVSINPGDVLRATAVGTMLSVFYNGTLVLSGTDTVLASGSPGLVALPTSGDSDVQLSLWAGGNLNQAVTGSTGVAGATVSYTGTHSGSVTADGSGDYQINVPDGTYTITPSASGYIFTPTSRNATVSGSDISGIDFTPTAVFSISGNAGIADATVSYIGDKVGFVTADGSGDYTIAGLPNGDYVLMPSFIGYSFSPTSQPETVSGSNITGVDFTATVLPVYSVPDCRNYGTFPNNAVDVNGTLTYTVPSNPSHPAPVDSRVNVPVPCGTYPQNSRKSR